MTVINGRVYPDHEFPAEVFGFHADRNSVHDLGTPFRGEGEARETIARLKTDEKTFRLRLVRYVLADVEEIECAGKRPEGEAR